jgi:predicted  nucleic acid-binding Zn-ribbon protein
MSHLDYNPFVAKLGAVDDNIETLERRRVDLADLVEWADSYNPDHEAAEIDRLHSEQEKLATKLVLVDEQLGDLETELRRLGSQFRRLEPDTKLGWRVHRFFSAEYKDAIRKRDALVDLITRQRERIQEAKDQREEAAADSAGLADRIGTAEAALERFRDFQLAETEQFIAEIDENLSLLRAERSRLEERSEAVENAVAVPLADLKKYEADIADHQSAVRRLELEVSQLDDKRRKVEKLNEKLSSEDNPYERRLLHEKCERKFGDGSPGRVIKSIRSEMGPLRESIGDHEAQLRRMQRNAEKTEQRIREAAAAASRDIGRLIIDGNNCCYERDDFIGLAALIPLVEDLAARYQVTVVFDDGIRGLLGPNDERLRAALPLATVHVVAPGARADQTILDSAQGPADWVISNDRFGDFRDKAAVKEGRLIRHEILLGQIFVHDLGVELPLADRRWA